MKKWMSIVAVVAFSTSLYAVGVETGGGVGVHIPDNENVERAVVGKVNAGFTLGDYLSLGISASQTGTFDQVNQPQEVQYANANPNAFAGKQYHNHDGDVIIIDNSDVTTIVNVTLAPPILPKRPVDLTERSMWMAEPYLKIGVPINVVHLIGGEYLIVRPYFQAFLGASGVTTYGGTNDIGISEGIGGGLDVAVKDWIALGAEWTRRNVNTGKNTYGDNTGMGKIILLF